MATVEHTHTEFSTKDEMADFRTIVTDMMMQLTQAGSAADARMDRFDGRMDRFEARLDEIGEDSLDDHAGAARNLSARLRLSNFQRLTQPSTGFPQPACVT